MCPSDLYAVISSGVRRPATSPASSGQASATPTVWLCEPGMPDDPCTQSQAVTAVTARGAVRFDLSDQVRALAMPAVTGGLQRELVVLAVPRPRMIHPAGLNTLGPDADAVRPGDRAERLYDLPLFVPLWLESQRARTNGNGMTEQPAPSDLREVAP